MAGGIPRVTTLHAMMGDPDLRWAVTILFGESFATYAYISVAQHDRWTSQLAHLLPLMMSVTI